MNMKTILVFILIIFIGGCGTTSKVNMNNNISEYHKDVIILSTLICEYLRDENNTDNNCEKGLNLNEIVEYDSQQRLPNYFEKIELKCQKGQIDVYYQFSDSRDNKEIELTDKEIMEIQYVKWEENDSLEQFDGKIQFDYRERFNRIRKIIIKK